MPSIVRDLEHKIFVVAVVWPYSGLGLRDRSVAQLLDIGESVNSIIRRNNRRY